MVAVLTVLSIIGFFISLYAFYVYKRASAHKNYKPLCDIKRNISCTKAFLSKEGKKLFLHNSLFGLVFYLLVFVLADMNKINYLLPLAVIAVLGSLYLAYISYIKQRNFCLVCTSIYLINILILVFSYRLLY